MKSSKAVIFYSALILVCLLSFFTFSENFFPLLNSDMAVNILMTPGFSFSHDLYFWGQNRSGSLIPMIAHSIFAIFPVPPVILISLVHYFILGAGFLALTRFIRKPVPRMIMALVWFFPPWHFLEFLLILYGVQSGCVIIALNFLDRSLKSGRAWKQTLWLSLSGLMFIVAVWVSDMAVISLASLAITGTLLLISYLRSPSSSPSDSEFRPKTIFIPLALFWLSAGWIFIWYARSTGVAVQGYDSGMLAGVKGILSNLSNVIDSVVSVLLFRSESSIESVFVWGLTTGIILLVFLKKPPSMKWPVLRENPWFYFFLAEASLTFLAVISSRWVYENGAGRRYFTTLYISFWIAFMIWLDTAGRTSWIRRLKFLVLILAFAGSLSSFWRFYYPVVRPSRIHVLSPLKSMGNIGIIAEYWNSYLSASPDPIHIKATPHDRDYVRNPRLAEEVLKQPKIYIIKDGWLNEFPDTILQFGRVLVKSGSTIHIADSRMNRYILIR